MWRPPSDAMLAAVAGAALEGGGCADARAFARLCRALGGVAMPEAGAAGRIAVLALAPVADVAVRRRMVARFVLAGRWDDVLADEALGPALDAWMAGWRAPPAWSEHHRAAARAQRRDRR